MGKPGTVQWQSRPVRAAMVERCCTGEVARYASAGLPVLVRRATPPTEEAPTGSVGKAIGVFRTQDVELEETHMTLKLGGKAGRGIMTSKRTPARWNRRPRRFGQDDLDGEAVQGHEPAFFRRRGYQRHLHQGRRDDAGPAAGAAGRAYPGRRDGGLPPYGHPARTPRSIFRRSPSSNARFPDLDIVFIEIGRRQSGRHLLGRTWPTLTLYVISVCQGGDIPRKGGPGITRIRLPHHQQRPTWRRT